MSVSHVRFHIAAEGDDDIDARSRTAAAAAAAAGIAWASAVGPAAAADPDDDANTGADTAESHSALLAHEQAASSQASSPAHALSSGGDGVSSLPVPVRPRKHLSARASSGASDLSEYEEEEALQLAVTSSVPKPVVHQASPYLTASLFSRLSYRWLSPLMDLGATRPLREEDMHEVMPVDDARLLMEGIEAAAKAVNEEDRQAEKKRAAAAGGAATQQTDPSAPPREPRVHVWRMLTKQFFTQYLRVNLLLIIYGGFKIVQPLMLDRLVQFVSSDEASWHGYLYAVAMGLSALGQALIHHQYFFQAVRVGVDMRIALNALIYKKALTLKTTHFMKTTTGQVVNLVSNDSARAEEMTIYIPFLWITPIECGVVLALLYQQVGVAAFAGFGAILLLSPMQLTFSKLFAGYRRYTVARTDTRVKTINEILVGADVLKMMGWEESLEAKVGEVRREEFNSISAAAKLKSINQAMFFASLSLVSLVTFFTMHFRGVPFTPANVFTSIALFNIIKMPLTNFIPFAVEKITEARVAFGRIQRFLELGEEVANDQARFEKQAAEVRAENARVDAESQMAGDKPGTIRMENASFAWELTEEMDPSVPLDAGVGAAKGVGAVPSPSGGPVAPADGAAPVPSPSASVSSSSSATGFSAQHNDNRQGLRLLNMHIRPGTLVGVVGSIGSYKSSLLAALLGEMTQMHGGAVVRGTVAYASQQSWIFAATIRDNILFGRPFDARRYARTIRACQLVEDIKMQPQGDQTQIGEKGVNLSGGQRARLSCARAVYGMCDIYLLDDPLAALDAVVASKLFDAVLSDRGGLLSGTTRVLVTHQTHLLVDAHIVYLEHGRIKAQGSFDELVKLGLLTESQRHAQADNDSVADGLQKRKKKKEMRERRRIRKEAAANGKTTAAASEPEVAAGTASINIVLAESSSVGSLSLSVFTKMFRAGGGSGYFFIIIILMLAGQAISIAADKYLAGWSDRSPADQADHDQAYIYLGLVLGTVVLAVLRARTFFVFILRAASALHGRMFKSVVYSPMRFFESNPSGRILNRFAKDQSIVDEQLPLTFFDFTQCFFMVIGCLVAVGLSAPYTLLVLVPILPLFVWVRQHFLRSSRELKRLDATTRSPVYAHFSSTLSGLMIIRSFHTENTFIQAFLDKCNANTRCFIKFQISARWFGLRLDLIAASVVACLSLLVVGTRGAMSPADAGFALSYCLQLTALFQWAVRQSAEVETMMTSVERIIEYGELPPEGKLVNQDYRPPAGWPAKGEVQFSDYKMRYRPGLDLVLKGVDFTVAPGEKVGVCGRTGAGKSSLFQALLRLVEPAGGAILIDGMEGARMGLRDLRQGLAIIPQYPVIFSGTLRYNLSPFGGHSDAALWSALEAVQLKGMVQGLRGGLDEEMAEFGGNVSVGEAQLICVARALLKPSKVLLVDEATANVDSHTDALIQRVIRERFADRTVLTIAHRLNTILDSDKIVVMAAGRVAEFGTPKDLLARPPADLENNPQATFGLFSFMANAKKKAAGGSSEADATDDIEAVLDAVA